MITNKLCVMIKYTDTELKNLLVEKIGEGTEKICFLSRIDSSKCFKLSNKSKSEQIVREIEYFEFLEKRKKRASFLPKYYGSFESDAYIGYTQECFVSKSRGGNFENISSLERYIEKTSNNEDEIRLELQSLREELLMSGIICSDLHGENILRICRDKKIRFVIIDGFGAPEFIPLCKYVKVLAKKKMERQWCRFEKRLNIYFNRRRCDSVQV